MEITLHSMNLEIENSRVTAEADRFANLEPLLSETEPKLRRSERIAQNSIQSRNLELERLVDSQRQEILRLHAEMVALDREIDLLQRQVTSIAPEGELQHELEQPAEEEVNEPSQSSSSSAGQPSSSGQATTPSIEPPEMTQPQVVVNGDPVALEAEVGPPNNQERLATAEFRLRTRRAPILQAPSPESAAQLGTPTANPACPAPPPPREPEPELPLEFYIPADAQVGPEFETPENRPSQPTVRLLINFDSDY